jgi:hypothetical protein
MSESVNSKSSGIESLHDLGSCRFFLGTHMPSQRWFDAGVPLFISRVRLAKRKGLPRASAPWALDSAGFTALHTGGYPLTVAEYAVEVRRYADEIGRLEWAAAMDYMCEPSVLAKTGGTVESHQRKTIANFLELRGLIGTLAAPVLQGWEYGDHERHVEMYAAAGVDLLSEPIVGVGSICRRDADAAICRIVRPLAAAGLRLHGFGVRTRALAMLSYDLASADSMAWSAQGRRVPGCTPGHRTEANCLRYALAWRRNQINGLAQLALAVA